MSKDGMKFTQKTCLGEQGYFEASGKTYWLLSGIWPGMLRNNNVHCDSKNVLDFPRYSGHSLQVRWANPQTVDAEFSHDFTH